jgi:hypothetical protein
MIMGSFVKFICTALFLYASYSWYVSGAVFKAGLVSGIVLIAIVGISINAILDKTLKKRTGIKFQWKRTNYYKP